MLREIEFPLGAFKFSAGHFTIFSSTERESLHGHTYKVGAKIQIEVGDLGLNFDYRSFKQSLRKLCKELNTIFLIPEQSQFLQITDSADCWQIVFDNKTMALLKTDVLLLPLANITIELLSGYLLERLLDDNNWLQSVGVRSIAVSVANTDMQSASAQQDF